MYPEGAKTFYSNRQCYEVIQLIYDGDFSVELIGYDVILNSPMGAVERHFQSLLDCDSRNHPVTWFWSVVIQISGDHHDWSFAITSTAPIKHIGSYPFV